MENKGLLANHGPDCYIDIDGQLVCITDRLYECVVYPNTTPDGKPDPMKDQMMLWSDYYQQIVHRNQAYGTGYRLPCRSRTTADGFLTKP